MPPPLLRSTHNPHHFISPPTFYVPDQVPEPTDTTRSRYRCMLYNYVNLPSLLVAPHTAGFFTFDILPEVQHHTQTLLVSDSNYPTLFQDIGFNQVPDIHLFQFTISTRIIASDIELDHHIVLKAQVYDASNVFLEPLTCETKCGG
ncbi:uncharacterized protein PAC_02419 [Phialocephala subalpina]|uniref:Uncharacterized protein n=1 Tax=Phialocephala subalpina TaxID=576137 RepID=A0A1L7WIE3_9HELO|nr:uncharacterized protein PAC_02419 [Phialocephala subalpina]